MTDPVVDALVRQRDACADAGSPFYATLLDAMAADAADCGPTAQVLGAVGDELPPLAPLRLLAGAHRLVLQRRAPRLALHYSSVGGDGDAFAAWPALREVLVGHHDELVAALEHPPQTNDVGRAAMLIGALHQLVAVHDLPVRLIEIGSSAGLNLWADRFAVTDAHGRRIVGPADAGVVLRDAWHGAPPAPADVRIVERLGCDLHPVDIATVEGRERLTSFVWPDDVARFERLRAALTALPDAGSAVVRADALDVVGALRPRNGVLTVLWHSVVTMYFPLPERREFRRRVTALHRAADASAPFAHVFFEPRREDRARFLLRRRATGDDRVLALGDAPAHGMPVTWFEEPIPAPE